MRTLVLVLMFFVIVVVADLLGFPGTTAGIILAVIVCIWLVAKTFLNLLRSYVVLVPTETIEMVDVVPAAQYPSRDEYQQGIGELRIYTVHAKADKHGDVTFMVPPDFVAED